MAKSKFKKTLKKTGKAIKKDIKAVKKFVKEYAPIVKKGAEDVGRYVSGVEEGLKSRLQTQPIQLEAIQLMPKRQAPRPQVDLMASERLPNYEVPKPRQKRRRPNLGDGLPAVLPNISLLGQPRQRPQRPQRPQGTLTLVKVNGKNYYQGQGGVLYPVK